MIRPTMYKDRPAIAVESKTLTALFLPEDGGKMTSLKTSAGVELLEEARGETYLPLTIDGSYVDAECSAFDDMFPTIGPCTTAGHDYPDHGEVCRIPHTAEMDGKRLRFSCTAQSVNAVFEKEIEPDENGITIRYRIVNNNREELPYIWAGHMMFAGRPGAVVFSNAPENAEKKVMFGTAPEKPEAIGEYSAAGESYKYYLTAPCSPLECGIAYGKGETVTVAFAGDAVRWLGVWMNNGSFKGMYNLALEPCTAPYDSPVNAAAANTASVIPAGGEVEFTMFLRYTPPVD